MASSRNLAQFKDYQVPCIRTTRPYHARARRIIVITASLKKAKRDVRKRARPGELAAFSARIGHFRREHALARALIEAEVVVEPGGEDKRDSLLRYEEKKRAENSHEAIMDRVGAPPRTETGRRKAVKTQLGAMLKAHMQAKKMKQTDIVEATGLTRHVVSRIVRGIVTNPDDETLNAIADALGLGLGEKAKLKALREA